ncbi:MAG TPA: rRNA maturation RNase YbeY [Candidatus Omnitrophota bacterium]|nr:rRNA maturation RNase YbeY [Candidatus Omnitrophota bacterium]
MAVQAENYQKKIRLNLPKIRQIARTIIRRKGIAQATLTVVFVTATKIRALNRKFLKRTYTTDVLAFDLGTSRKCLAGDVIISVDAASANAKTYGTGVSQELALYLVHGILHLLGYDDHRKKDIVRMRREEKKLMAFIGPKIPSIVMKK